MDYNVPHVPHVSAGYNPLILTIDPNFLEHPSMEYFMNMYLYMNGLNMYGKCIDEHF